MQYLISQIVVCLVVAALIGAIIGWWLKSVGSAKQIKTLENHWETRYGALKDKNLEIEEKLETQEKDWRARVDDLEKKESEARTQLEATEKDLTSRVSNLEVERDNLSTRLKLEEKNSQNYQASMLSKNDEAEAKLAELEGTFSAEKKKRVDLEQKHENLLTELDSLKSERDELAKNAEKEITTFKNSLTALQLERDGLHVKLKDLDSSSRAQISDLEKKCDNLWSKHETFKENALRSETKVKKFIASFPDTLDDYDIEDIEGIGKGFGDKLRAIGIAGTGALLDRCGDANSRREISEKLNVEGAVVRNWVSQADLMRVRGIGGQYAELLEAAGIQSVKDLQRVNAIALAEKMKEINDEDQLFPGYYMPDAHAVTQWIEQAQNLSEKS